MHRGASERSHDPSPSIRKLDTRLMLVDKTPAPGTLKGPGRSMPSTGAATDAPKGHKLVSANNVEPQGLLQSSINMLYTSSPIVVYTLACATGLLNIGRLLANVPGVHQKVHDLVRKIMGYLTRKLSGVQVLVPMMKLTGWLILLVSAACLACMRASGFGSACLFLMCV